MRSEFDAAEEVRRWSFTASSESPSDHLRPPQQNLDILIAHTRTHELWPHYAARITLHHAHLAHALGRVSRALDCYRVAAGVAEEGSFVRVAAQAGEICLRIGLTSGQGDWPKGMDVKMDVQPVGREEGMLVARACRGMGETLEAIGQIIEACLSPEILKFK